MAKGGIKSVFNDPVVPTSSGSSDLELNGSAKTLNSDYDLGGSKKFVITVGEGQLPEVLTNLKG